MVGFSVKASTRRLLRLMALTMAFLITALIALYRERLRELAGYGYPGVFLISLLGNATVIFPVPSLMAVFAGGGVFNPAIVGLVAGVGEALGELTGYMAGYGGKAVVEDRGRYERLEAWMRRNGVATIFALSLIPNPFFDLAGIAAGALRFPLGTFLLSCWLGKTVKTLCVAFAGAYSIGFIERLLGA